MVCLEWCVIVELKFFEFLREMKSYLFERWILLFVEVWVFRMFDNFGLYFMKDYNNFYVKWDYILYKSKMYIFLIGSI